MSSIPYVTRRGYHYEVCRGSHPDGLHSVDSVWDLDLLCWLRDEYAMLLAKEYMRQHRDALLMDALNVLDRHEKQIRYGLDPTLSELQIYAVARYAQELRDVPQQPGFPREIVWPKVPFGLDKTKHEDHLKFAAA